MLVIRLVITLICVLIRYRSSVLDILSVSKLAITRGLGWT